MKKGFFNLYLSCKKAFSLIELLVGLIIISLLISAFIPLITKKLKASDITVGSFGNSSNTVSIKRDVTKKDCEKMNAVFVPKEETGTKDLCVMKYNAGDGYYGEKWDGIQKCTTGSDCSVANGKSESATKDNLTPTCWVGTTSRNCDANFGGYSGCNRTVCNWSGANKLCENIGWRLATDKELDSFTNENYSSSSLGSNGLMFCNHSVISSAAPMCANITTCFGSYNNDCYPGYLWSSSFTDSNGAFAYNRYLNGGWGSHTYSLGNDFSTRCVLDEIIEETKITCPDGYHAADRMCFADLDNCLTYDKEKCTSCLKGFHTENGKCIADCQCENGTCEEGKSYCTSCDTNYSLYNNQCVEGKETQCYDYHCAICRTNAIAQCTSCKPGYILKNGRCYFGSLEGCNNPTYDDTYQTITCASCEANYTKCYSGSCRLTSAVENGTCPSNTLKIGCTCVQQYNIGDGYYGESVAGTVQQCTPESCTVQDGGNEKATAHTLQPTCWKNGYTALPNRCNGNYSNYSGCQRTVCNRIGANKMCESLDRRLPTMPGLVAITNETYSSTTLGSSGLMFCDYALSSSIAPLCYARANFCVGTYTGFCDPANLWSDSVSVASDVSKGNIRRLTSGWYTDALWIGCALSTRCVIDL